jgi:N-acetylmuramoyl-L-alanine amidase
MQIDGQKRFFSTLSRVRGAFPLAGKLAAAAALTLLPSALQCFASVAKAAAIQTVSAEDPVASGLWLDQNTDRATLTVELSAPIEATAFVLAEPARLIVDLPQIDFAVDPEAGRPAKLQARKSDLIASFRYGQIEPGKSRIVIDLASPARVLRLGCEGKPDGDAKARLIIELAKTDEASFRSAVQATRARLAKLEESNKAKDQEPAAPAPVSVIVIDPGHGGIDRGASVKGIVEKDLALEFAKALAAKLESLGRFKIAMTRDDDRFVSLSERVRMGRDRHAALFVSIHADTISRAAGVSGATVYTLSDRASDKEAARVAEKENQSDIIAGFEPSADNSDVSSILFDLARRETRAYSHMFAHTLVNYWRVAGRLNKNPRRSAGFRVLMAPDVPSVLLELGYLTNRADAHALASAQWRDDAAGKVAEAIASYFASREKNAPMTKADPDLAPGGTLSPAAQ